jgi:hypothetical protein
MSKFFCGLLIGGAYGAGLGAASGAIGAAVLSSAGHPNYSTEDAAKMTAAGSAVICAAAEAGIISIGKTRHDAGFLANVASYVGQITLGGLLGYGMFQSASMTTGTAAAASAVGASITAVPVAIVLCCCLGAAMLEIANESRKENEKEMKTVAALNKV